jgi:hypothetical protein
MGSGSVGGRHSQPNHAVEPTPNSFRSYVAPAIGHGSPPALDIRESKEENGSRWIRPVRRGIINYYERDEQDVTYAVHPFPYRNPRLG